jgi:hypothetical protein
MGPPRRGSRTRLGGPVCRPPRGFGVLAPAGFVTELPASLPKRKAFWIPRELNRVTGFLTTATPLPRFAVSRHRPKSKAIITAAPRIGPGPFAAVDVGDLVDPEAFGLEQFKLVHRSAKPFFALLPTIRPAAGDSISTAPQFFYSLGTIGTLGTLLLNSLILFKPKGPHPKGTVGTL